MEGSTKKGLIAVTLVLGAIGAAYYFLVYKKKKGGAIPTSPEEMKANFEALKTNLGSNVKLAKDGLALAYNGGERIARFYTNNRFMVYDKTGKNLLHKGSYGNGGRFIKMDNGQEINGSSVWDNLNLIVS